MIGLLLISGGVGLYPNLIISTTDAAYNLTIFNAASAENTLVVTLIVAVIGMPFVLLYSDRRVLHLPGQDRRRPARLLGWQAPGSPVPARGSRRRPRRGCSAGRPARVPD